MRLNELFNTTAGLKKIEDDEGITYTSQLQDGSHLRVSFSHTGFEREFECTFARGKRADWADVSFSKTGMGSEVQVMSVVVQAIMQFMQEYDPWMISFTADKTPSHDEDEPEDQRKMSRTNLYARMISRIKNPNYVVKTVKYGGFDEYQIIKKDTAAEKKATQFDRDFGSDLS